MAIRIGIVGTGRTVGIAANHAAAILQENRAEISALYNRSREGALQFAQTHCPKAKICDSYAELLEAVDAVVVCTPNSTHADYAAAALKAGKALLLEKPMGIDPEKSRQILQAQKATGAFGAVGYVFRFTPTAQALKRLVNEKMGRIYSLSMTYGGTRLADPNLPLEWRMERTKSGPGALADFGSHLFDLTRFACGFIPQTLSCHTQTVITSRATDQGPQPVDNDDSAVVSGIGKGGELFSMLVSRVGMDGIHLCISGEGGLIRADFDQGLLQYLPKDPNGPYGSQWQNIPVKQTPRQHWYDIQMSHFISGLEGSPTDLCTLAEGLQVEEVIFSADQAAQPVEWAADYNR